MYCRASNNNGMTSEVSHDSIHQRRKCSAKVLVRFCGARGQATALTDNYGKGRMSLAFRHLLFWKINKNIA